MRKFTCIVVILALGLFMYAKDRSSSGQKGVVLEIHPQGIRLFVTAEEDLSQFLIKGQSLEVIANCRLQTITLTGQGEVVYKKHRIVFSEKGVTVDGKTLPATGRNFVLMPTGDVEPGFVRNFDKKPR